jgi:hypothetical protein
MDKYTLVSYESSSEGTRSVYQAIDGFCVLQRQVHCGHPWAQIECMPFGGPRRRGRKSIGELLALKERTLSAESEVT